MFRIKTGWLVVLGCTLWMPAQAGFDEAFKAYQAQDFATAAKEAHSAAQKGDARAAMLLGGLYQTGQGVASNPAEAAAWYEKAAQGNLVRANAQLARLYARGEGIARNPEKALTYARRGAQLGDAESQFMVFALLNSGPLGYLDATGRPDPNRYNTLAGRDLASRALDTEARDALYRAAAQKLPQAQMALVATLASTVGEGNNARLRNAAAPQGGTTPPMLEKFQSISRQMASLGDTLASPQLFFDALTAAAVAAKPRTCSDATKQSPPAQAELVSMALSQPLAGAKYLPSAVAGYERAYLVAGAWEERWTFRGCGKSANVRMKFTADGLGGAKYAAQADAAR